MIDEFASRFVYFYAGYWLAPHIFRFAEAMLARPVGGDARLSRCGRSSTACWCSRATATCRSCRSALGLLGAGAVVTAAALMAQSDLLQPAALSAAGNSIVIYLAFFLRHGGEPHRAAQDRHHHRHRHHLAAGDDRRRGRRAGAVLAGARTRRSASCSCGRSGRGSSASGLRRCSRRNSRDCHARDSGRSRNHGLSRILDRPLPRATTFCCWLDRCSNVANPRLQAHIRAMPAPAKIRQAKAPRRAAPRRPAR